MSQSSSLYWTMERQKSRPTHSWGMEQNWVHASIRPYPLAATLTKVPIFFVWSQTLNLSVNLNFTLLWHLHVVRAELNDEIWSWTPVWTNLLPLASKACTELIEYGCKSRNGCGARCGCKKANWSCTELCGWLASLESPQLGGEGVEIKIIWKLKPCSSYRCQVTIFVMMPWLTYEHYYFFGTS